MNTESISEIFQKAIYEAVKDKPIEELKTLDWFTYNGLINNEKINSCY